MSAPTRSPARRRLGPVVGRAVAAAVIVAIYLFLLAPILIVLVLSFSSGATLAFPPPGFSLDPYVQLAGNTRFLDGLVASAVTASVTTVLVLAAALPAALALVRGAVPFGGAIEGFFVSPLLVPAIVLGLGLMLALGPLGVIGTYPGIVIAHFAVSFPYAVRTVLMSLRTVDTACAEAAATLGAAPVTSFFRITLPLVRPGVLTGGAMAFLISFDEAVLSLFVAGSGVTTLPVEMFRHVQDRADPQVAALSVALIAVTMVVVLVVERFMGLRRAL